MFSHVVELYRSSGRPVVEDGVFSFNGQSSAELTAALKAVESAPTVLGRFTSEPEWMGNNVEFSWLCGSTEHGRFYQDIEGLITLSTSLSRGEAPKSFYLIEEDYCAGESPVPAALDRTYLLCNLISLLEVLSLIPDTLSLSTQPKSLIFVIPASDGQPPRTLPLVTRVDVQSINLPVPDLQELTELSSTKQSRSLHWQEYRSLYRLAVSDVLAKAPHEGSGFRYLISNWSQVLNKYHYDVDCYIDNFSFDKLRMEVSKNSLEFSQKLTTVMGDNTAKFLALPVPIVALIAMIKVEGMGEAALLIIGALAVAVLFSGSSRKGSLFQESQMAVLRFRLLTRKLVASSLVIHFK